MRNSGWTPSIVPKAENDQNVYIVLDDCRNGRAYRETDVERADLEAGIMDMLEGQHKNPVRVIGFNTAEGWSQDVSADVAQELRRRCDLQLRDVPFYLEEFVERHEGRYHEIQLPLPIPPSVSHGVTVMAKDACDRWWEWVEKPAESTLIISAHFHEAIMRPPPEQRSDRTAVNDAVRLADPEAQR